MEESNNSTNDSKPKNVSIYYWIGFGLSVVISFLGAAVRGQVLHLNLTIPIGLGFFGAAVFSMLVHGKPLLSFAGFIMATILAFAWIRNLGGFAF